MNNPTDKKRMKLRLYVIGKSPHTEAARKNFDRLLADELRDAEAEIINILDAPELAYEDKITTAPALVRLQPMPRVIFLGDLSDTTAVLEELAPGSRTEDDKRN